MTSVTTSTPTTSQGAAPVPARRVSLLTSVVIAGGAGLGVALLLVAGLLWARYGTGVFFDVMSAGLATCL